MAGAQCFCDVAAELTLVLRGPGRDFLPSVESHHIINIPYCGRLVGPHRGSSYRGGPDTRRLGVVGHVWGPGPCTTQTAPPVGKQGAPSQVPSPVLTWDDAPGLRRGHKHIHAALKPLLPSADMAPRGRQRAAHRLLCLWVSSAGASQNRQRPAHTESQALGRGVKAAATRGDPSRGERPRALGSINGIQLLHKELPLLGLCDITHALIYWTCTNVCNLHYCLTKNKAINNKTRARSVTTRKSSHYRTLGF